MTELQVMQKAAEKSVRGSDRICREQQRLRKYNKGIFKGAVEIGPGGKFKLHFEARSYSTEITYSQNATPYKIDKYLKSFKKNHTE